MTEAELVRALEGQGLYLVDVDVDGRRTMVTPGWVETMRRTLADVKDADVKAETEAIIKAFDRQHRN